MPRTATVCRTPRRFAWTRVSPGTGVWACGHATYRAPVTWTVLAAKKPGGSEVELVRRTAWELKTVLVTAPEPGPHYYRACMTNTSAGPVHHQLQFGPNGQLAFPKTGSHTAVLGVGGRACGEVLSGWLATAGQLTGSSHVPVRFGVRVSEPDGQRYQARAAHSTTVDLAAVRPPERRLAESAVDQMIEATECLRRRWPVHIRQ